MDERKEMDEWEEMLIKRFGICIMPQLDKVKERVSDAVGALLYLPKDHPMNKVFEKQTPNN